MNEQILSNALVNAIADERAHYSVNPGDAILHATALAREVRLFRRSTILDPAMCAELAGWARNLANAPVEDGEHVDLRIRMSAIAGQLEAIASGHRPERTGAEIIRYCGDDAARWAEMFMEVVDRGAAIDFGLMVGWFANAIESRPRPSSEAVRGEPAGNSLGTSGAGTVDP